MNWLEITVPTVSEKIDLLQNKLEELGVSGIVINDEAVLNDFIENGKKYWDYIDDDFVKSMKGVCTVQFYLEDSQDGRNELSRITAALPGETFQTRCVKDEDWENNWKQYYQPINVGERLVIVPQWLDTPDIERIPLRLDPGLIFGTGAHATTRMCLEAIEKHVGKNVLDLGCGSGILGIAALLLGAEHCTGCDIDEKAPDVVMHNGQFNNIGKDRLKVYAGDILSDSKLKKKIAEEKYDLILANIVADVIIAMVPGIPPLLTDNGTFICSGIIDGRENEVKAALENSGFTVTEQRNIDNWHSFTAVLK